MRLNLLEPIPLEPASYDLIHARFLFIHVCVISPSLFYRLSHASPLSQLRDPYSVLTRVIPLLKPGGWLLIEDGMLNTDVQGDVPGIRASVTALIETFKGAGQDPRYVAKLGAFLRDTGAFSVVEAQHAQYPVNPPSDSTPLT
jgi:hypothetical protein